jgi:hypothetical protein
MALGTAGKQIVESLFGDMVKSPRKIMRGESVVDDEPMPSRLVKPEMVVGPIGIESSWKTMPESLREAEIQKVDEAKQLFDRGTPNDEILAKTGFWFDENNIIKKEIDDKDATFKIPFEDIKTDKQYKLGEVFGHESMFKFYPGFKDVPVEFYKGRSNEDGEFVKGKIRLNKNGPSFVDQAPEFATAAILHEVQHTVQKLENFTKGGNMEMFLNKPLDQATQEEKKEAFRNYLRIGGEAEARNVAFRYIEPLLEAAFLRTSKTKGKDFLKTLTQDPTSIKWNVNKNQLINTQGEPIDMRSEDLFYQDPFERTID